MERYKLKFLQSSLDDLEEIVLYIAKDSKESALKMHDLIIEKTKRLSFFPKTGVLVQDKKIGEMGFRMLVIDKYIAFYKIDGDTVHIHRVLHGARNYPILFNKSK